MSKRKHAEQHKKKNAGKADAQLRLLRKPYCERRYAFICKISRRLCGSPAAGVGWTSDGMSHAETRTTTSAIHATAAIVRMRSASKERVTRIEKQHAAVVSNPSVQNGHPDIDQDTFCQISAEQLCKRFPGVSKRVSLQKGILAAISSDLKLWPGSKSAPRCLRLLCVCTAHKMAC